MIIEINGIGIHAEEQRGENTLLEFLHCQCGSSGAWYYVTSNMSTRFHAVAVDHRGWGQRDALSDGYGQTEFASDREVATTPVTLESYDLIAHFMVAR